jgi:hypothetical protein
MWHIFTLQQYCFPYNCGNCYTHNMSLNTVLKKKQLHFHFFFIIEVRCLTPLSTISQLLLLWQKLEYPEKTTDLWQVTEKLLSHNVLSSTPLHAITVPFSCLFRVLYLYTTTILFPIQLWELLYT